MPNLLGHKAISPFMVLWIISVLSDPGLLRNAAFDDLTIPNILAIMMELILIYGMPKCTRCAKAEALRAVSLREMLRK